MNELEWDIANNIEWDKNETIDGLEVYYYSEDVYRGSYIIFLIRIYTNVETYSLNIVELYDLIHFIPLLCCADFRIAEPFGMRNNKNKSYVFNYTRMNQTPLLLNAFNEYQQFNDSHLREYTDEMMSSIKETLSEYEIEYEDDGVMLTINNNIHIPYKSFNKCIPNIIQPVPSTMNGYVIIGKYIKHNSVLTKYNSPAIIVECSSCHKHTIVNWSEMRGTCCLHCQFNIILRWTQM